MLANSMMDSVPHIASTPATNQTVMIAELLPNSAACSPVVVKMPAPIMLHTTVLVAEPRPSTRFCWLPCDGIKLADFSGSLAPAVGKRSSDYFSETSRQVRSPRELRQ